MTSEMKYLPPPLQSGLPVLQPTGESHVDVVIPSEFRNAVVVHLTKNYMRNLRPALILAIQGPPGEGKSFQIREVCSEMGVPVVFLSGASLSGPHEGASIEPLRKAYLHASGLIEQSNRMAALLIDDFDLSVASRFGKTENTVNTQLLLGFLMNLADDPLSCAGIKTFRVPIIVTGNNFTALHEPLRRPGRMNLFTWTPSREQKYAVVESMFAGILDEQESVGRLFNRFKSQPVSFFSALREDLADHIILKIVSEQKRVNVQAIESAFEAQCRGITVDSLMTLAERRARAVAERY